MAEVDLGTPSASPGDLQIGHQHAGYGEGPPGPPGPTGPQGQQGEPGPGTERHWPSAWVAYLAGLGHLPQDIRAGFCPIGGGFPGAPNFNAFASPAGVDFGFKRDGFINRFSGYMELEIGWTKGNIAFVMPQGFRPPGQANFVCVTLHAFQDLSMPVVPGIITIDASGNVRIYNEINPGSWGGSPDPNDPIEVLGWDAFNYSALDPVT